VPDGLVRGFQQESALAGRVSVRSLIAGAEPSEAEAETAECEGRDRCHARGEPEENSREGDDLRDRSRTTQQALLEPELDVVHPVGQRPHCQRGGAGRPSPMIAVSRAAQAVKGKEGI